MVITAPTRITIEVHAPESGHGAPSAGVAQVVVAPVQHAEDARPPAAYEPEPCHCLDDEDCAADHEHE